MNAPIFEDTDMQEIYEGFLIETRELLDNISQDLMMVEESPEDLDLINKIFRSFHTIKGTSSFMGFDKVIEITHHAEDILNKLRHSELLINRDIIDVLLESHDWIARLIDSINTDEYDTLDFTETLNTIEKLKSGDFVPSDNNGNVSAAINYQDEPETKPEPVIEKTNGDTLKYVLENSSMFKHDGDLTDDEVDLLDKAFRDLNNNFNSAEDIINSVQTAHNAVPDDLPAQDAEAGIKEIQEIAVEPDIHDTLPVEAALTPAVNIAAENEAGQKQKDAAASKPVPGVNQKQPGQAAGSDTIRIDVSRIEAMMDLSGELVLGRNRLSQISKQILKDYDNKDVFRELAETTSQVDFITSEIQATVMRMRMVQIGKLYQKAPRIVRDLSKEFNKKIKLVLKGEETEIDKGIIEELNDPLVHMIRNSCDHGIESAGERIAAGKPEEGTIILDAFQEGNHIVIKISDDGKGIDPEKIKAKALEKELITKEQAAQMSRRDILQLIFAPGFSTAQVVSAVSGRGVGMDVVITNIKNLKGMIDVDTEVGVGTTFTIKLPLTLAIIQGLLIKVGSETYALPLSSVEEVVAVEKENIHLVNQKEFIRIRSNVLPLVRLNETLRTDGTDDNLTGKYVVVVGLDIHRLGLVVDELLGQQEIVIKSVGEYLGHIRGIAGSTILGDGRVILIIDIADLMAESI